MCAPLLLRATDCDVAGSFTVQRFPIGRRNFQGIHRRLFSLSAQRAATKSLEHLTALRDWRQIGVAIGRLLVSHVPRYACSQCSCEREYFVQALQGYAVFFLLLVENSDD